MFWFICQLVMLSFFCLFVFLKIFWGVTGHARKSPVQNSNIHRVGAWSACYYIFLTIQYYNISAKQTCNTWDVLAKCICKIFLQIFNIFFWVNLRQNLSTWNLQSKKLSNFIWNHASIISKMTMSIIRFYQSCSARWESLTGEATATKRAGFTQLSADWQYSFFFFFQVKWH